MSPCTPALQEEKKGNGTIRTVLTELVWGANQMQVIWMPISNEKNMLHLIWINFILYIQLDQA